MVALRFERLAGLAFQRLVRSLVHAIERDVVKLLRALQFVRDLAGDRADEETRQIDARGIPAQRSFERLDDDGVQPIIGRQCIPLYWFGVNETARVDRY